MLAYNDRVFMKQNLNQSKSALSARDYYKNKHSFSVASDVLVKKVIEIQTKESKRITEKIFKSVNF